MTLAAPTSWAGALMLAAAVPLACGLYLEPVSNRDLLHFAVIALATLGLWGGLAAALLVGPRPRRATVCSAVWFGAWLSLAVPGVPAAWLAIYFSIVPIDFECSGGCTTPAEAWLGAAVALTPAAPLVYAVVRSGRSLIRRRREDAAAGGPGGRRMVAVLALPVILPLAATGIAGLQQLVGLPDPDVRSARIATLSCAGEAPTEFDPCVGAEFAAAGSPAGQLVVYSELGGDPTSVIRAQALVDGHPSGAPETLARLRDGPRGVRVDHGPSIAADANGYLVAWVAVDRSGSRTAEVTLGRTLRDDARGLAPVHGSVMVQPLDRGGDRRGKARRVASVVLEPGPTGALRGQLELAPRRGGYLVLYRKGPLRTLGIDTPQSNDLTSLAVDTRGVPVARAHTPAEISPDLPLQGAWSADSERAVVAPTDPGILQPRHPEALVLGSGGELIARVRLDAELGLLGAKSMLLGYHDARREFVIVTPPGYNGETRVQRLDVRGRPLGGAKPVFGPTKGLAVVTALTSGPGSRVTLTWARQRDVADIATSEGLVRTFDPAKPGGADRVFAYGAGPAALVRAGPDRTLLVFEGKGELRLATLRE